MIQELISIRFWRIRKFYLSCRCLLKHYDEFETIDFFDDKTLRKCIKYLYHVNADSDIVTEGEAIMDAPINQLYGIRLKDDQEEFVWLGLDSGILKKLDF